ncbi:MarR family transcriptional regulator [Allopusillimonas soli]|uniref:MarR family transcriptional regulator n=1 Tax=Allopusillimonas soli TaxID=659016 RepID=A0A853FC19_9BURK|nr:MarR family transcriptional regulator [Allopusillimonas soli]NYT37459.1 MarR family transcriptional regulator [Allopusillimonas soli]TEA74560.1 MarR family transcriptional regulator [Allopusillimonas soli]
MTAETATFDLPKLEHFLTYRLHVVNKLSDRDTHSAYLDAVGMPLGEARCLAAIGRFEPLSMNEVARAANLDKSHASRSVQALVERGLVLKQTSETDGRSVVLKSTSQGKRRYRDVVALIARRNEEIFGCLSESERCQLAGMLDRVIAAMRA